MTDRILTLAEIKADAIPLIQHWLRVYPALWWGGMATLAVRRRRPEGEHERLREETLGAWGVGQVTRAAEFIDQAPRIGSFNRRRSTYGWKHVAERFQKARSDGDYYVGEGAFMMAAWGLGARVRTFDGSHYVNLSENAAKPYRDGFSARPVRATA
jgi:hypothetical protein